MSEEIRPFTIDIPQAQLDDLQRRLEATRWPEAETVDDWSQGTPLSYVQDVCRTWATSYDWRRLERRLNAMPQFVTDLDGLDVHFLHLRSKHESATPLVITHGWPGSIVEFLDALPLLTDPASHGGTADDAFHVVCPTLPGFGFSGKPTSHGWSVERTADAWAVLMQRLGYTRYGAQGGDWGSAVTTAIALQDAEHCLGIHLNMAAVRPDPDTMDDLTELEKHALERMKYYRDRDSGYSKEQSTRPQTVGYGLVDSPAGQAAWILEKFWAWTDCMGGEGSPHPGVLHPENALTREQLLDNIMMYWLPAAGASSARIYWESFGKGSFDPVDVSTGYTVFPREIFSASERWMKKRFPNLVYYNERDRGGHFAAFENPQVYVEEVRAAFRAMR